MKNISFLFLFLFVIQVSYAQEITNVAKLQQLSNEYFQKAQTQKTEALEFARINNIPVRIENESVLMELIYIDERGNPQYYSTSNANAAATSATNEVYSGGALGLSLDGTGIVAYEWDAGSVLSTHQELIGRISNEDAVSENWHSTHVAGTILASGIEAAAKGMASAATLKSHDWNYDVSEMANEAANGMLISNHSYGWLRGWEGSTWWGDSAVSTTEDYRFGFYDYSAKEYDEVAVNAPYYLIVKSAGNDRDDVAPTGGVYPDNDGPYDCIDQLGIAKNILTVGAIDDIPSGYSQPSDVIMTGFSSWGPADDGRIKPDIVANGTGLYSSHSSANNAYSSSSGTSMSTPATTGSLALLIQHYENIVGSGSKMRSATLKALVLHTADETGTNDGPDYSYGWGLLNTQSAAAKITEDQTTDVITEQYLADGETYTRNIITNGTSPIRVTIVWTDPAGTPPAASLDPADIMLVNDLDLKITQSTTYYPWKLDKNNPSNAATKTSENNVDNVEMVDIASPLDATNYTITIDHDGTLSNGGQAFSMIISGDIETALAPTSDFYADNTSPGINQEMNFTDASANVPTSWLWAFSPTTVQYLNGTSSTSHSPEVEFTATGTYDVSLYTSNATGNDTETKTAYITVSDAPSNYCEANSDNPFGYISRVQIGGIDKTSGYSANSPYYQDWTVEATNVTLGQNHSIIITNGSIDTDLDIAIWIDWNRDGDFEDTDENIIYIDNNSGEGTFTITVPADAELGSTRMRIRTKYYDDLAYSCGSTWYGEVEDYKINVLPGTNNWLGITYDWNTASNWSDGNVPNSSYEVIIPSGVTSPIIPSGTNAKCYSLTLENDATLEINGNLEVEN